MREATRRGIPKRRKLTEKVKAVLMQGDSWHVPDKQIHRWEGEGGAEYLPGPRRRSEY
ncbi:hypothetical protein [Mycobacterium timonense]|uniref:hypothetical protein n=1 Tax=Mycobacterium timonense TaxID=701043 RepID=UPI001FCA6667|nr:hypothetical protein [Mycobacterium timonense]